MITNTFCLMFTRDQKEKTQLIKIAIKKKANVIKSFKEKKKNLVSESRLSGYKVGEKQMVGGWASNTCKHLQIKNMKTDTVHLQDVESIKFLLQQLPKKKRS